MKFIVKPTTKHGKLSLKLLIAFFILFGISQIFYVFTISRAPDGTESINNPVFAAIFGIIGLSGMTSAIGALFMGIYAFFKEKERGLLIYLSIIFGLFALAFVLGEIFIPH